MRLAIATVLGVALEEWGLGFFNGISAGSIGPRMLSRSWFWSASYSWLA
jgi:hypothetical protein